MMNKFPLFGLAEIEEGWLLGQSAHGLFEPDSYILTA